MVEQVNSGNTSGGAPPPDSSTGQQPGGSPASNAVDSGQQGGNGSADSGAAGAEGAQGGKSQPRDGGLVKRINTLTRQKYELQARLDALERLNQGGGGNGAAEPGQGGQPKQPSISDFTDFNQYLEAMVEYRVQQGLAKTQQQTHRQTTEALTRQQQEVLTEEWLAKIAQHQEAVPDFEEVVMSADTPVSTPLMQAIMEADEGPAVLYYLAQNPKEVRKLNTMSGAAVSRHIGRLEERLAAIKTQSAGSKAPKVPETVNSSGAVNSKKDPADTMPIADWMAAERERVRKKYGRT